MTVVIGVDPGASETGLVLRDGNRLLAHEVVARSGLTRAEYLTRVRRQIEAMRQDAAWTHRTFRQPLIAVEDLNPPTPHLGMTAVKPLLGTAVVLGAVLGRWPDAVVVPPGGNGGGALSSYPEALVSPAERRMGLDRAGGSSPLRHCRSSWDVAGTGLALYRARAS